MQAVFLGVGSGAVVVLVRWEGGLGGRSKWWVLL